MIGDLFRPRPLTRSELAIVVLVLVGLGAVAFGPHVARGGLYNDDWSFNTTYYYAGGGSFFDRIDGFDALSFRPLAMLYWPITYAVFGANAALHLASTVVLGVGMATALFVLLRTLGFEPWHACILAALVLVVPAGDATRLWTASSISSAGILLYLLGCTVAIRALRRSGKAGLRAHVGSLCLYAASILFYEIATVAIVASVALYLLVAPPRSALRRWAADAALVVVLVALFTSHTFYDPLPLSELPDHAHQIVDEGTRVIAQTAVPFGIPRRPVVGLVGVAIVAAAAALLWRGRPSPERRAALRRWLAVLVGSVGAIAVGWASIVPAAHLSPLSPGQHNRANALAAIGIVLALYSVVMLAATLVTHLTRRGAATAAVLAAAAALVIGVGYVDDVRADGDRWDEAADAQRAVVGAVRSALARPPRGTVVFAFGYPAQVAPGIPVFSALWDLDGALKEEWDTSTIAGLPMIPGTVLRCGRDAVRAVNENDQYGPPQIGRYGRTVFVDVGRRRSRRVATREECRAASRTFRPGPNIGPAPG